MEQKQPSGSGQGSARTAAFQRKYLSLLVTMLRRGKIERATSVSTRCRTVKLAAYLSLAMTAKGRTAWSRAILGKYLFRLQKSRCQLGVVKSRRNLHGIRRSANSAKNRPGKPTAPCKKSARRLGTTASKAGQIYEEDAAGGTVASRMQTLRLLVPGSHGLETPVFLKEAADYIVALKMQVQAMQALADCSSNSTV